MSDDNPTIDCPRHGRERAALVCQHIPGMLVTRVPVGFFWSRDDTRDYPDAWCAECHERHERAGFEWEGEALAHLKAKILCATCYLEARRMCIGR